MKPYVRHAILADFAVVAQDVRLEDKLEIETMSGLPITKALAYGYAGTDYSWAICTSESDTVGVFGVTPETPSVGKVWMIGTTRLPEVQREFLRQCRYWIDIMHTVCPHLYNFVAKDNKLSVRWLRWCGFKFLNEQEINGLIYYEFAKVAHV